MKNCTWNAKLKIDKNFIKEPIAKIKNQKFKNQIEREKYDKL
jgi:hypothetical protein